MRRSAQTIAIDRRLVARRSPTVQIRIADTLRFPDARCGALRPV